MITLGNDALLIIMMESLEDLNCDICFDSLNEDSKCPRIIPCGHTFCHECISKFIKEKSPCPSCNRKIKPTQIEHVPKNYFVLSLIQNKVGGASSNQTKKKNELEYDGKCQEHSSPNHFYCKSCDFYVCGTCLVLHHKECKSVTVSEFLASMRKQFSLEETIQDLEIILQRKTSSLDNAIQDLQKLELQMKEIKRNIENEETKKNEGESLLDKLKKTQIEINELRNYNEISDAGAKGKNLICSSTYALELEEMAFSKIKGPKITPMSKISKDILFHFTKYCKINARSFLEKVTRKNTVLIIYNILIGFRIRRNFSILK